MELLSEIKEIICSVPEIKIKIDVISKDSNLIYDLNYNSVNVIQLLTMLEDSFDIEFIDEDLDFEKIIEVGYLYSIIEKKLIL